MIEHETTTNPKKRKTKKEKLQEAIAAGRVFLCQTCGHRNTTKTCCQCHSQCVKCDKEGKPEDRSQESEVRSQNAEIPEVTDAGLREGDAYDLDLTDPGVVSQIPDRNKNGQITRDEVRAYAKKNKLPLTADR